MAKSFLLGMRKKFLWGGAFGVSVLAAAFLFLDAAQPSARWYSPAQVSAGAELYSANCLSCHGVRGVGDAQWRRRNSDGAYPPPPLDGTAHTWHHNLGVLRRTIDRGGAELGGQMPAFGDKLSAEERDAIIAYFQSLWPDKTYQIWLQKVQKNAAP